MKTVKAFNATTQQTEDAICSVDKNLELLFTFENGHFIKLPGHLSTEEIKEALTKHEEQNAGQISAEIFEKQKLANEAKLNDL